MDRKTTSRGMESGAGINRNIAKELWNAETDGTYVRTTEL